MASISVVIPTYNEEKNIDRLLKALKPQIREGDELIIVDSHSKDRTVEVASKYTDRIITMPREGIGPAKNLGAEKAGNDIVAFLDADGPPAMNWLSVIRSSFEDGKVNGVAGLGLYTSDSKMRKALYNSFARFVFFLGELYYKLSGVPWLPVNNCVLRKRALIEHGGYGKVVCEDLDFGIRAKGLRGIVYDQNMVVNLSDRRFRDEGFFNTVLLWAICDLKIFMGGGVDSEKYRATR